MCVTALGFSADVRWECSFYKGGLTYFVTSINYVSSHHAAYFKYLLALLVIYTSTNGFPGSSDIKNLPARRDTKFLFLGREDPLEEGMATHSSILPWRSPWTEEPGGLQSIALQSQTGLSRETFTAQ